MMSNFRFNHAQSKLGDQGILSDLLVLVQNYIVKCISEILLLKHDLTMISLQGVCTHPKVSLHGLKSKS